MGVVVGQTIKVNGYAVGKLDECKYEVPTVFDATVEERSVYVIGRSE